MLINARFLTHRTTGVQRFAREIVRASVENEFWDKSKTRLVAPPVDGTPDNFANVPVKRIGQHTGHLWEQLDLPRAVGDEALINLCNSGPLFLARQMIVLHDAAVAALPQNFTPAFRAWYQVMIRTYGRRAQKVGTVSKFSADDIVRHFGIRRDKIEIIPESGEHILRELPDHSLHKQFGLDIDSYFLAVSSLASNKNFLGVLKAVARLPRMPFKFVIVGGRNAKIFTTANVELTGATEVGFTSDAQLRALYESAACFVYPSFYEGFGLPPLEAMSCGCPVLVANAAALPETCGKAAVYCDPYDPDDIAKQLSRLLGSKAARDELRAAGLARAKEWTWKQAAHRLSEIKIS
ncbi:MAG TPA: glycosyltransferase family 1 protein [Methylocella sp.]|nr:glycosyltransferase family 1 protein [Methylocella sp.]